jgi:hypothetical protein
LKTSSSDLFFLIKSLSKHERAYFKKYAKRYSDEDTLSLKLFELIEKQVEKEIEYDEESIRLKLNKVKNLNQLSVAKNYLYDLVLKSLLTAQSEKSLDDKLDKYIAQAELLMNKTLFEQSMKMLKKAKKIAYEYENYTKLYTILQIEKNLFFEKVYPNIEKLQNDIFKEELHCLETLKKKSVIQNLSSQITSLMVNNGLLQDEKELKKAKAIMSHPYLQKMDEKESYTFKVFFYHIHTTYNSITTNFKKTFVYMKQFLEMVESYPWQVERKATNLLNVSYNMMVVCTYCKKYDEFFYYLERFRTIPERYKILNTEYVKSYMFLSFKLELIVFFETGQFENGVTLAESIERKIEAQRSKIRDTEIMQYYFFISCCYFGTGDFKNSLKWINKLLNLGEPGQRKDLYMHSKLFNLVVHYELGNKEHLDYIIKSTYKFVRDRKKLSDFEKIIFQFFNDVNDKITRKEIENCFREFNFNLTKLQKKNMDENSFRFFDYVNWSKSKFSRVSFKDLKIQSVLES